MKTICHNTALVLLAACTAGYSPLQAEDIQVTGCFLSLRDQAQIPARERGLLKEILVEPGDQVSEAQLVAVLEDRDARLALELAELDRQIAEKQLSEASAVGIAEAAVEEAARMTEQARLEQQISSRQAESDIAIRQAAAAIALARDAFDRAVESRDKFRSSVSSREMATLQYELDRAQMDEQQAKYDQSLQQLRASSQAALVRQRETVEHQKQLELDEAQLNRGISRLTVEQMRTSVEVAAEKVDRMNMKSPLTGLVVEKLHHAGEWVEAGDPVLRVVRLDVLYVEGFVGADQVDQSFQGRDVVVTGQARGGSISVNGRVVFVSPEIDSVNGQVQVRAEIDNQQLQLRPGQSVEMVIRAE